MKTEYSQKRLLLFNLAMDRKRTSLAFAVDWVNCLAAKVGHIDVITMRGGEADVADNVTVYSLGLEQGRSKPGRVLRFYSILLKLLCRNKYDGCFTHMNYLFGLMAAPLLKLWRIKNVLWYAHRHVSFLLKVTNFLVDQVLTATPTCYRVKTKKVNAIGHGIDTNQFVPAQNREMCDSAFNLISIGRVDEVKNIHKLIDVAGLARDNIEANMELHIYGASSDNNYREKLSEQIKGSGLSNTVFLHDPCNHKDVPAVLGKSDIFLSMSDTGSMDKAVLEAMACGVIPLTTGIAYEKLLAKWPELCCRNAASEEFANQLVKITGWSPKARTELSLSLRKEVVENHNLDSLSEKVLSTIFN